MGVQSTKHHVSQSKHPSKTHHLVGDAGAQDLGQRLLCLRLSSGHRWMERNERVSAQSQRGLAHPPHRSNVAAHLVLLRRLHLVEEALQVVLVLLADELHLAGLLLPEVKGGERRRSIEARMLQGE